MKKPTRRQMMMIAVGAVVLIAVIYAFLPDPVAVDVARITRAPLQVIVEEEGETHLENRYVVTSPVAAYARRIELEEGDIVQEGDVLVQLEPPRAAPLDVRSQAQAEARVRAAAAAVEGAAVVMQRTQADRGRIETLYDAGAVTQQEVEQARAAAVRASAGLDAAQAELIAARAAANAGGTNARGVPDVLRAPADGRVLAVHRESEGHVNPGEPLVDIGNTRGLEIQADVLSQDAVSIRPGTPVVVDQWGGDTPLEAVVARVEPQGKTEISALGVEEQRVSVRARITSPQQMWSGLGSGYRVLAHFVVWQGTDVLQVPTSALFRSETGDGWSAFAIEDGRAVRRDVRIGRQAGLATQILDGLAEGEQVIVHPPNELEDGTRVEARDSR